MSEKTEVEVEEEENEENQQINLKGEIGKNNRTDF